jgi:hypothetical protein
VVLACGPRPGRCAHGGPERAVGLELVSGSATVAGSGMTGGSRHSAMRCWAATGKKEVGCNAGEPGRRNGGAPTDFWLLGCKRKRARSEEG